MTTLLSSYVDVVVGLDVEGVCVLGGTCAWHCRRRASYGSVCGGSTALFDTCYSATTGDTVNAEVGLLSLPCPSMSFVIIT